MKSCNQKLPSQVDHIEEVLFSPPQTVSTDTDAENNLFAEYGIEPYNFDGKELLVYLKAIS